MNNALPDCLHDQLPNYEIIEEIPQTFSDSTHRLWHLQHSGSYPLNHILKICRNTQSPFWQIMHGLFDYDLKTEIPHFAKTYELIEQACCLEIPRLIKAQKYKGSSFILTQHIEGIACNAKINHQMVIQLAKHLAELHSLTSKQWGSINNPKFIPDDWPKRLENILIEIAQPKQSRDIKARSTRCFEKRDEIESKWGGVFSQSEFYLKQAIQACDALETTQFVAMMPDLRWDQFLQNANKLSALVDLDAFVYAPRELDFVILEYLLSSDQINTFTQAYSKHHGIPDIKPVRPVYRLLLFYMNILGEDDLDSWMKKEVLFVN